MLTSDKIYVEMEDFHWPWGHENRKRNHPVMFRQKSNNGLESITCDPLHTYCDKNGFIMTAEEAAKSQGFRYIKNYCLIQKYDSKQISQGLLCRSKSPTSKELLWRTFKFTTEEGVQKVVEKKMKEKIEWITNPSFNYFLGMYLDPIGNLILSAYHMEEKRSGNYIYCAGSMPPIVDKSRLSQSATFEYEKDGDDIIVHKLLYSSELLDEVTSFRKPIRTALDEIIDKVGEDYTPDGYYFSSTQTFPFVQRYDFLASPTMENFNRMMKEIKTIKGYDSGLSWSRDCVDCCKDRETIKKFKDAVKEKMLPYIKEYSDNNEKLMDRFEESRKSVEFMRLSYSTGLIGILDPEVKQAYEKIDTESDLKAFVENHITSNKAHLY